MGDGLSSGARLTARISRYPVVVVAIGIFLRGFRYWMKLAMNGDECALGLNVINRSGRGFFEPLDYGQVALAGFLFLQRGVYELCGMSEYAMRLMPTLAGIGALMVFWLWARLLLRPLGVLIATGIIAVGMFVVQHGVEAKPYGFDLLASAGILYLTTRFLLRGESKTLVAMIVLTPVFLAISYPASFMLGSSLLAMTMTFAKGNPGKHHFEGNCMSPSPGTPGEGRGGGNLPVSNNSGSKGLPPPPPSPGVPGEGERPDNRGLVVAYAIVILASFIACWVVASAQYRATHALMSAYWKDAFPPRSFWELLRWLAMAHTGSMFGYPIGGKNFLSAGNFLLFAVGMVIFAKIRPAPLTIMLIAPFALTLGAAVFRRYPYGESERVEQHLVPVIALLMGLGASWLIERWATTDISMRWALRACVIVLLALSIHVLIINILHRGTIHQFEARDFARNVVDCAGPGTVIAVIPPRKDTPVNVQWYLRESKRDIVWDALMDPSLRNSPGKVCVITSYRIDGLPETLEAILGRKIQGHIARKLQAFGPPEPWEAYFFGGKTSSTRSTAGG